MPAQELLTDRIATALYSLDAVVTSNRDKFFEVLAIGVGRCDAQRALGVLRRARERVLCVRVRALPVERTCGAAVRVRCAQRFPYAIGNAVFNAFWYFVPGSRNRYVAAFKLTV